MDNQISDTSQENISIDDLQQELNEALLRAEENLSGWKRAQADLENYRKRKEAESGEWIQFGQQSAFVQMLPILDSLEQAFKHAPEVADEKYVNWKTGLDGIVKQMNDLMTKMGIQKIEAVGKTFDPNYHEAIRQVEGENEGIVAEEFQTGYMLNGKVLRPAQVAITKKSS